MESPSAPAGTAEQPGSEVVSLTSDVYPAVYSVMDEIIGMPPNKDTHEFVNAHRNKVERALCRELKHGIRPVYAAALTKTIMALFEVKKE